MTLKEIMLKFRQENKISQRQFAIMCGLSNGYISMLEKGFNPNTNEPIVPTLPTLKKLASGMGMLVDELMVTVDDMPLNWAQSDAESLPNGDKFSHKEIELIGAYRKASLDDRQIVDLTLKKYMNTPYSKGDPAEAS